MTATVTGLILSGGRGSRMGGVDKGLQPFRGRTLVEWVIERLEPQVAEVLISANRNLDRYLAFGHPVVTDREGGFAGPLAGFHAGLGQARSELLMVTPCDSPLLPVDLVPRMLAAFEHDSADVAVVRTRERAHPVFCLCRVALLDHLTAFFQSGGRKVDAWYSSLRVTEVDFDDEASAFRNINTPEDLTACEQQWVQTPLATFRKLLSLAEVMVAARQNPFKRPAA
jgi:molybdenum cofactor guanylyltransferase